MSWRRVIINLIAYSIIILRMLDKRFNKLSIIFNLLSISFIVTMLIRKSTLEKEYEDGYKLKGFFKLPLNEVFIMSLLTLTAEMILLISVFL